MVFQQWSGVNAILYYAAFVFQGLGLIGNTTSLLASGVGGILMFLATIPAVLYIDQFGRKPVLIVGAIGMGLSHIIVASLYGTYSDDGVNHSAAGWVAVVIVWTNEIDFGYSWGVRLPPSCKMNWFCVGLVWFADLMFFCLYPASWVVLAEVFPLAVRAKGISIGGSSNWLNNFAIGQATPPMIEHMSYGTFIFFGLICLIGGLFIWVIVPETRNLTLEEMDKVFGDEAGNAVDDRNRLLHIYTDLGLIEGGLLRGDRRELGLKWVSVI